MTDKTSSTNEETLMEFPCEFTIKTMGLNNNGFDLVALKIVQRHVAELDESSLASKISKNAKYVSVSITFQAQSKKQLDAIYQDLTDSEQVLMSL